ncbi:MAG TPA: hypothetical protein DHW83_05025, partial [Bacteroidales bacterium]|nr:hypothetical protein [Bacteroidales bacterium]
FNGDITSEMKYPVNIVKATRINAVHRIVLDSLNEVVIFSIIVFLIFFKNFCKYKLIFFPSK